MNVSADFGKLWRPFPALEESFAESGWYAPIFLFNIIINANQGLVGTPGAVRRAAANTR